MSKEEKKQREELANAGGAELTEEQMNCVAGGTAEDNYIHCPKCNSINLQYMDSAEQYRCNDCKTYFTYDRYEGSRIIKTGGCG